MNNKNVSSPRPGRTARRTTALAVTATAALLALTACGGSGDGLDTTATGGQKNGTSGTSDTKPSRLLWMGDSIGEAQAPALGAAMKAGHAEFKSMAAAGGGGVLGKELSASTWQTLPKELKSFKPDVVAYQITTYDWGTRDEQRAAYERLAKTVNDAGAQLLIVSAPPFKIDDFYKKHEAEITTAPKAAKEVADKHPDTVRFLDASALWGSDSSAAKAQRSKDGIHSCQQGSAAFATWFGEQLSKQYGFTPAPVDQWATGKWTGDKTYSALGCQ
ncbi:SGNH/GDSL hydrolase family protein [Streptomyces sp. MST-110588]|uniref:SGNH/GDSL hydrolase family protein n=1 Tax=Streptomyces sp. MST-110588 TaxID=2833628 RepID=UPI001F5DD7FC|nr:SGNH/GDSL hydrolase family protein [Streptomyces sp. MST-110588]UNO40367.1 SGNH/GDSL hydrolase family protein [Streptomyces sp. MST-110588]